MKTIVKEITGALFEHLWQQYLRRVAYARIYSELANRKGGKVVHDHIAFRTLNTRTGEQPGGFRAFNFILDCLGYKKAGNYEFPKKKLKAIHFEHSDPMFPKIFVSQLEVEELPRWAQKMANEVVPDTPYLISDHAIELLNILKKDESLTTEAAEILTFELTGYFRRPWDPPPKEYVLKLNDVSQYAAWTLLHGNSVAHFATLVNSQGISGWPGLDATCEALKQAGVPMKETIEGREGSILRQTATQAVKETVAVLDENGNPDEIEWTYACYELAERGYIGENGEKKLFSGFLGEQASHLFGMTRTRDN